MYNTAPYRRVGEEEFPKMNRLANLLPFKLKVFETANAKKFTAR